jgi:hypothetical protein
VLALVAGVVGFAFVVRALGWDGMRAAIVGVGGWFAVLAAVDFAGSCCDAAAVHGFLSPHASVPYRRVFAAQLSGIAINRLTPGNTLGEPVKITMLVRGHVPADVAVSSIVLFNLTTMYVGVAAVVIGVPVTALLLDLPPDLARAVWIALGVLIVLAIGLGVLVRRGALRLVVRGLAGARIISAARAEKWHARVASIDAQLRSIGNVRAPGFACGFAGVMASRVFNWIGTVLILHATHIPMTAPLVIASLSVGILVTWASNIVPFGLGLADGTNYALYGLLGASPVAGLLFTVVNRLRTIVLALIGLCVMAIASKLEA